MKGPQDRHPINPVLSMDLGIVIIRISKIYTELRSTMTTIITLNLRIRILECPSPFIFRNLMTLIKREERQIPKFKEVLSLRRTSKKSLVYSISKMRAAKFKLRTTQYIRNCKACKLIKICRRSSRCRLSNINNFWQQLNSRQ